MKKIIIMAVCLLCSYTFVFAQPGALDTNFANKGKFIAADNQFPLHIGAANAVTVQPNGKIIMVGDGINYSDPHATADFAVTRLTADGTLDNSFSGDGKALIDFSTQDILSADRGVAVALQPNGKIIVVGFANDYYYDGTTNTENLFDIAVARLNADGSLDNSFDGDGKKLIDLSALTGSIGSYNYSYDYGTAVVIKAGGKICIAGHTYVADGINQSGYDAVTIQLNSDGSLDNIFDGDGIRIISQSASDDIVYGLALQSNNKLVLGGITATFTNYVADFLAIRLNGNGASDNSFDTDGFASIDLGGTYDYGNTIVLQADGKILINGGQSPDNYFYNFALVRLNANGTLDNSFDGDGIQTYSMPNEYNAPNLGLALQHDGKIIQTGGNSTNNYPGYSGGGNFIVIRYNADGSLDNDFGNHGRSVIDFGNWTDGFDDGGTNCTIQADGKIVAVGVSTDYTTGLYNNIAAARLLIDGTLVILNSPGDQTAQAPEGECSVVVNNIDPILEPANSNETVNYTLYGATTGSGTGSASGMQFNVGVTTVVYTLPSNQLQRAVFSVTVSGTPGGALDFDGADDRVNLGILYAIGSGNSGEYSFEAWIKPRAYSADGSVIFGNERNGNGGILVELDANGYISTYQSSVGTIVSSYKVPLDEWTHIAFIQTTAKLDLYVNGDFVETLLIAPNLHIETYYENYLLGAYTSDFVNYSRYFNGEMDEVRVWDKAVCTAQILNNLHCEISGYTSNLSGYYKFNQGIVSCNNPDITYLYGEPGTGTLENFALNGSTSNWVAGYVTGSCVPFNSLVLYCPEPVTVNAEPGQCNAIVNFSATASSGCSPDVTITYSQDPGTYFSTGTTYVNVTATDGFGNQAFCQFPVTVNDANPPVLITKNISLALNSYGNAFIFDPYDLIESLTDDCGLQNVYTDAGYFDCNGIGIHTVNVTAIDLGGNSTTQTATVNITPYVTSATIEAVPSPVQYSDMVTFKARILNASAYYDNGCTPASEVTFKIGSQEIGTASLTPEDYYGGNLVGVLDKQGLPGSIPSGGKLTAIFGGTTSNAVSFNKKAVTFFEIAKEDATINFIESQLIKTPCPSCSEVLIPVAATITDFDDGYRGDISNASVTFTINPVTAGASITGSNTITIPAVTSLNIDRTAGIVKGKFKVSMGAANSKARFNIVVKVDNRYTSKLTVPVNVTRLANIAPSTQVVTFSAKLPAAKAGFDVTVLPNPTHSYFKLTVLSNDKSQKINARIMDITGRLIELKTGVNAGEIIQLGQQYKPGTYMVEIKQGQNSKVVKLVKL